LIVGCQKERSFKVALFREDGMRAVVNVLENNSDEKFDRFKLEVVKVEQSSSMFKDPEIGEVFSVEQSNEGVWGGMWSLDASDEELAAAKSGTPPHQTTRKAQN
jgi:hypothetical protein